MVKEKRKIGYRDLDFEIASDIKEAIAAKDKLVGLIENSASVKNKIQGSLKSY